MTPRPSIQSILQAVADYYNIDTHTLTVKVSRKQPLAEARQVTMTLLKKHRRMRANAIADIFKMDRTNILYGVKKINGLISVDDIFRQEFLYIESKIAAGSS
jgi:chromosomal replication initiation ATPase DnaA